MSSMVRRSSTLMNKSPEKQKTAASKHKLKKLTSKQQSKSQWDDATRLPEGLTFEEIGELKIAHDAQKNKSKKAEAKERRAKESQMSQFIQKNKSLVQNVNLKMAPWQQIDQYIS